MSSRNIVILVTESFRVPEVLVEHNRKETIPKHLDIIPLRVLLERSNAVVQPRLLLNWQDLMKSRRYKSI
jgi:hypothetical protein